MRLDMGHTSDCAVHNAPAYEPGECDCGASEVLRWKLIASNLLEALKATFELMIDYQALCEQGGWPATASSVRATRRRVQEAVRAAEAAASPPMCGVEP